MSDQPLEDLLKEEPLTVKLKPTDEAVKFDSIQGLKEFLQEEQRFFSEELKDASFNQKIDHARSEIDEAVRMKKDGVRYRQNLSSRLNAIPLFSSTTTAKFLYQIRSQEIDDPDGDLVYRGAKFVLFADPQPSNNDLRQLAFFKGVLETWFFLKAKDSSGYVHNLLSAGQTVIKDQSAELTRLRTEGAQEWEKQQERLEKGQTDLKTCLKKADSDAQAQLQAQRKTFDESKQQWQEEIANLEELYQKKLSLEAPVKYWEKLQSLHERRAKTASRLLLSTVGIAVLVLFLVLYQMPDVLLGEKFGYASIKGTLILITMVSIMGYVIHLTARSWLSSRHLAHDAEERRQLTYVYLALMEKEAITSEELNTIILQALFSRAESGLLKGDHGPEMPTSIPTIAKMLGGKGGN